MTSPFNLSSFNTYIGKKFLLRAATLKLPEGSTTIVDGIVHGPQVEVSPEPGELKAGFIGYFTRWLEALRGRPETKLVINGYVECVNDIVVPSVVITGSVKADKIVCEGVLAIKSGAKVQANEILYRDLVIEDGAIILAKMSHLDYVSHGEQT
jgi:hypothetical protein